MRTAGLIGLALAAAGIAAAIAQNGQPVAGFAPFVPAIQESREVKSCILGTESGCVGYGPATRQQFWTCADKSRILLTAENGSHWCMKTW